MAHMHTSNSDSIRVQIGVTGHPIGLDTWENDTYRQGPKLSINRRQRVNTIP